MSKLTSKHFTSSGTWTCPAGVTSIYVLAQGGGAGGNGGMNSTTSTVMTSGSTIPYITVLNVIPNTTYTITVGAGGAGGVGRTSSSVPSAGVGGDTSFGALYSWLGGVTYGGSSSQPAVSHINHCCPPDLNTLQPYLTTGFKSKIMGIGTSGGSYRGGKEGLPSAYGSVGGTGGNGNSSGVGGNGGNATGFGASGGGGGAGSAGGGTGGSGAPGQMWVIWVE